MSTKKVDIDVKINADTAQAVNAEKAIASITTKTKEHAAAIASITTKTDQFSKSSKTLGVITAASTGNISGMARAVGVLSNSFGAVTMVAAAFFAAVKAGLAIQSWLWKTLVDDIKGVEPVVFKTRKEFDELNKVKLDTLKEEIQTIQQEANAVLSAIERAANRATALRAAQAAAEKARIMAEEPAGPARDLKIAALEKNTAEADIAERETVARKKLAALAKSEAAIRAKIAEAEKADQEVQDRVGKANKRFESANTRGAGSEALTKIVKQVRAEGASSAASLADLRGQLDPQLTAIGEGRADAQNQLAIAQNQRSTAGSTYSSAQQAASTKQAEIERKAAAAQAQAELKQLKAQQKELPEQSQHEIDVLTAKAGFEQADVASANQAIDTFKSTTKFSPKSYSYQSGLRELEDNQQQQLQEAEAVIARLKAAIQSRDQAQKDITQKIANLESSIGNLEN